MKDYRDCFDYKKIFWLIAMVPLAALYYFACGLMGITSNWIVGSVLLVIQTVGFIVAIAFDL